VRDWFYLPKKEREREEDNSKEEEREEVEVEVGRPLTGSNERARTR
jgi:hypothetical protein